MYDEGYEQDDLGELGCTDTLTYNAQPTSDFRCVCHPSNKGHSFDENLECEHCEIAYSDFVDDPKSCTEAARKPIRRGSYRLDWNQHKKMWMVRLYGKIVDSVNEGILLKATFKQPKSGTKRARRPSIHAGQRDWYPDATLCGNYKTMIPVKYIHGSSKWYSCENSGQPNTPILEYRAVFITPQGEVYINPMLDEGELRSHLGVSDDTKLW